MIRTTFSLVSPYNYACVRAQKAVRGTNYTYRLAASASSAGPRYFTLSENKTKKLYLLSLNLLKKIFHENYQCICIKQFWIQIKDRHYVGPDQVQNYLQRLSADNIFQSLMND